MPVVAAIIYTSQERDAVMLLNDEAPVGVMMDPRAIDNPLANNLGHGTLTDKFVSNTNVLIDPEYAVYHDLCSTLPIRVVDTDFLFAPFVPE